MTQNHASVRALGLSQTQAVTAVSKMFASANYTGTLGLANTQAITAVSKMFASTNYTGTLGLANTQAITAVSKMFASTKHWDVWNPILKNGSVFASTAADLQTSHSATADAFAAVAAQRISALNLGARPGSFDSQFAAIARRFNSVDFPSHPRPVAEGDAQVLEVAAANMGLSAVPSSPADRLMLEILLGFVFMIVYGVIQLGMTGDPITPSFVIETAAAGGLGFKSVTWAPQALEKLKKL